MGSCIPIRRHASSNEIGIAYTFYGREKER